MYSSAIFTGGRPLCTQILPGHYRPHSTILSFTFRIVSLVGHPKHAWTSYSSFESVFKFFDEQYKKRLAVGVDNVVEGSDESCCLFL